MSKSNKHNSKYEKDKKQDYKSNEDGIKIKPINKKKEHKIKYANIELNEDLNLTFDEVKFNNQNNEIEDWYE